MGIVNSSRINLKEGVDWAVKKFIEQYNADVVEEMYNVVPEVARDTAKRLRQESPKGPKGYSKGWTSKIEKGRLRIGATIYGKHGTYQLAHLLEHGHATRNGTGRVFPSTPAKVHIAPVNEWANDELVDRVIERLNSI